MKGPTSRGPEDIFDGPLPSRPAAAEITVARVSPVLGAVRDVLDVGDRTLIVVELSEETEYAAGADRGRPFTGLGPPPARPQESLCIAPNLSTAHL